MSGLRQPPGGTIFNVATDINADVEFLNKLTQLSYVAEQPNHILHDRRWYEQTTHQDTYRSMMTLSQNNRRVLYEKHNSGIDSLLIYTPINVNNVISDNLALDIPIYVIFRGTDNIWDVFKDLNLLFNYTTGEYYDASGIQTLVSQIGNYLENQIFNSYSENVVFLSHSLGSKIALNVMDGFKDTIHNNRIKHNVMFNPYIVVDNVYENALSASNDYKSKFEAFIIDGDFASVIYKNHPIGNLFTFGNIVPEGSWIQEIQTLTRQQYLNVANHNITAFTNQVDSYPQTTFVHYEPDQLQDKQISSLRTFALTAYDTTLTDEEIYLRKRSNENEWKVGNINVDSEHIANYDIDIRVASDGKTDMIWKNGYWSYPLEFGVMVNGSLTWDSSNIFYMVRAYNEQSEQSYYMIGIFNNDIKYYRTRFVQDYSTALTNQDKKNLSNAFALESEPRLTQAQSLGQTSLTHKAYRWFINNPDLPTHTGHDTGLRRSLLTQTISNKPIHGNCYKIRHSYLSGRVLGVYRLTSPAAFTDEGQLVLTYDGNAYEDSAATTNKVFKCLYDETNDTYQFLDIKYLEDNTTGSIINTDYEVFIGETNILQHNWAAVTAPNNTSFQLIDNLPENVIQQHAGHSVNITSDEYFLMKNTANHYIFVNDAWAESDPTASDYRGSIDPITTMSGYTPDWWGLWKFEEVEFN